MRHFYAFYSGTVQLMLKFVVQKKSKLLDENQRRKPNKGLRPPNKYGTGMALKPHKFQTPMPSCQSQCQGSCVQQCDQSSLSTICVPACQQACQNTCQQTQCQPACVSVCMPQCQQTQSAQFCMPTCQNTCQNTCQTSQQIVIPCQTSSPACLCPSGFNQCGGGMCCKR